jgi:hypothetical protein
VQYIPVFRNDAPGKSIKGDVRAERSLLDVVVVAAVSCRENGLLRAADVGAHKSATLVLGM